MSAALSHPEPITDLARRCEQWATDLAGRHQGGTLPRLYHVLAHCMELCERCVDPDELAELHALFAAQPLRGNRRYVEAGSDIYVYVCRYVFHNDTRANSSRYAHCLREAARLQIRSNTLVTFLRDKGGLNALFLRRPLKRADVATRCLRLTESITCPKEGRFTITLERMPDGMFKPWSA